MNEYLTLKKANCKNCHKCIRSCPVKSIRYADAEAHIIPEECVLCGQCFVSCPQNAKKIRDDTEAVKADIATGQSVVACIAPSFVANYRGATLPAMREALQKLGFSAVYETAAGASLVKKRYEQILSSGRQSVVISSCCPSVNSLIQKYYPKALSCLANVITPMEAACRLAKQERPGCRTVFIGPCIAKKREGDESESVDHVLTFMELSAWLEERGVELPAIADELAESRSRLFPLPGGILNSMDRSPEYAYVSVDGMDNCIKAIKDIIAGGMERCFVEMSACSGSCVGGPAMEKSRECPVSDALSVTRYAGSRDYALPQPEAAALMQQYPRTPVRRIVVSEGEILDTLKRMGKTTPEQELNCGTCGYPTCREKAIAVCQGKAELSMCLPYLKEKAESFSDTIIKNTPNGVLVLSELLEIQDANAAACRIFKVHSLADIRGMQAVSIMDPGPLMEVLRTGRPIIDKRTYLAEYGKYVAQSVLYDKNYRIVVCILRDITEDMQLRQGRDQQREATLQAADRVIENQMRTVQQIASLLGETASETKIALTKLKESLNDE